MLCAGFYSPTYWTLLTRTRNYSEYSVRLKWMFSIDVCVCVRMPINGLQEAVI